MPDLDAVDELLLLEGEEPPGEVGRVGLDVVDRQVDVDASDLQRRRRRRRDGNFRRSRAQDLAHDDLKCFKKPST